MCIPSQVSDANADEISFFKKVRALMMCALDSHHVERATYTTNNNSMFTSRARVVDCQNNIINHGFQGWFMV
jgi:hypothetical protein